MTIVTLHPLSVKSGHDDGDDNPDDTDDANHHPTALCIRSIASSH